MSLRDYSQRTGESLSAVKRQSINEPETLRLRIEALTGFSTQQDETEVSLVRGLDIDPAVYDLISLHFKLASLRHGIKDSHPDLFEQLTAMLDVTRPYVEEPRWRR